MNKKKMRLQWMGIFIELCVGRITGRQKEQIDARCPDLGKADHTQWYENMELLQTLFAADNWWSVDDLDHVMGLVFADRAELESGLATLQVEIEGTPTTVDPGAFQLSFYAPETIEPVKKDERIICHGARREAQLHLEADFEPPFDPSLATLSFIDYPGYGLILIDLDYDGHDDVELTFGPATYLKPRFFRKDFINDTSR